MVARRRARFGRRLAYAEATSVLREGVLADLLLARAYHAAKRREDGAKARANVDQALAHADLRVRAALDKLE